MGSNSLNILQGNLCGFHNSVEKRNTYIDEMNSSITPSLLILALALALALAVDTRGAVKRIGKEQTILARDPPPFCSAGPVGEDIWNWEGVCMGMPGPYQEDVIFLHIQFPEDFPFSPPKMTVVSPIDHPKINNGVIDLDILGSGWSPALTISKVLHSFSLMLAE